MPQKTTPQTAAAQTTAAQTTAAETTAAEKVTAEKATPRKAVTQTLVGPGGREYETADRAEITNLEARGWKTKPAPETATTPAN